MFRITSFCFTILFLGLTSASITNAQTENYSFVTQWSSWNNSTESFNSPWDITIDPSNNVYVTDDSNGLIAKFDNNGNFITEYKLKYDNTQLYPVYIALDSSGNIFVSTSNNYIYKFDKNGNFVTKWGSAIVFRIDSSNDVYVFDGANYRIQKFDDNGKYLSQFSLPKSIRWIVPKYMCFDSSNNLYVTDSINRVVYKFDINNNLTTTIGSGKLSNPRGIAIDSSNNIYVGDSANIQKFDSSGAFITKWGSPGKYSGQIGNLAGIAVDSLGDIFVVDNGNKRIEKFSPNAKPFVVMPPVANFTSNVTEGNSPLTVQFTDSSQNAEEWKWEFGDGTTSTEQNPTHTYFGAGTENVDLTVSNSKGSNSTIATIYVHPQVSSNVSVAK